MNAPSVQIFLSYLLIYVPSGTAVIPFGDAGLGEISSPERLVPPKSDDTALMPPLTTEPKEDLEPALAELDEEDLPVVEALPRAVEAVALAARAVVDGLAASSADPPGSGYRSLNTDLS